MFQQSSKAAIIIPSSELRKVSLEVEPVAQDHMSGKCWSQNLKIGPPSSKVLLPISICIFIPLLFLFLPPSPFFSTLCSFYFCLALF